MLQRNTAWHLLKTERQEAESERWGRLRRVDLGSAIRPAGCVRIVHLHCRLLRAAVVRVVRLVVHHQLIVHKVEAVGLRLVRVQDHLPDCEEAPNTR